MTVRPLPPFPYRTPLTFCAAYRGCHGRRCATQPLPPLAECAAADTSWPLFPVNSSPDYLREVGIGNYPTEEVTDTVHQGGIVSIYCASGFPLFPYLSGR